MWKKRKDENKNKLNKEVKDEEGSKNISSTPSPSSKEKTEVSGDADGEASIKAAPQFDRKAAAAGFGELVMLMMTAQRYWHMSIHELEWLALQPLMRNQVAVAMGAANKDDKTQEVVVGAAIWARVSADVDLKIKQQIEQKVFPVRLKPEDWTSGDIVWLLDVIAPTKLLATKLFTELGKAGLGEGRIQAHPVVASTVDVDFLRKAGAKVDSEAAAAN